MSEIVLIAHNIRSCYNIGSIFRSADGLGVNVIYLTGYSPYPLSKEDERLPYIAEKMTAEIHKTALGAENYVTWYHEASIERVFKELKMKSYAILGLEQHQRSTDLTTFTPKARMALVIGNEITGIEPSILAQCQTILEIPMAGRKESLNVASATAIALYHLRFCNRKSP